MPSSPGDFGGQSAPAQCTAMSRRSGQRCRGPAVLGSRTQKCRMHGGKVTSGTAAPNFKSGRHSRYLPSQLDALYQEALANPDLLELADHIALLEARINEILATASQGEPVPKWSDVRAAFDEFATGILGDDDETKVAAALESIYRLLDAGSAWDRTWTEITATMEQLRRMADTEIKRKKELNLMVPVDRVMVLMAAVGMAVKRNVTNPEEIKAVYRELAMLQGGNLTPEGGNERLPPDAIVLSPSVQGPSGGQSREAIRRRRRQIEAAAAQAIDAEPEAETDAETEEEKEMA